MVTKREKKPMMTIQIEKEVAEMIKDRGRMGDTYSTVIRRLLNGAKPEEEGDPHGDRDNELTGIGHHKKG